MSNHEKLTWGLIWTVIGGVVGVVTLLFAISFTPLMENIAGKQVDCLRTEIQSNYVSKDEMAATVTGINNKLDTVIDFVKGRR